MTTTNNPVILPVNITRQIDELGMTQGNVGYIVALAKSGIPIEALFIERNPELESIAERIWHHINDQSTVENFPTRSPLSELRWRTNMRRAI